MTFAGPLANLYPTSNFNRVAKTFTRCQRLQMGLVVPRATNLALRFTNPWLPHGHMERMQRRIPYYLLPSKGSGDNTIILRVDG
jgi:hypothetical protein